ncbi:hypothetical protein DICVIV_14179 [Dictyocaulus viviparus]|uniref:Uncharacterized protein n=1 Tax=Dictyocaulus viviparus TaxID=29172 RepID=A0A0D8X7Z9_DICVI|nr:hypothetical protein DICVIV_14179 [Dictyocaulus viviparus]
MGPWKPDFYLKQYGFSVSMSLQSSAFLLHHGEIIQKFTSDTAMVTTIGAEARVSFVNVPFDVCLTIQSGDVYISSVKTDETTKKPRTKKTLTRSRTHRGITFRLDEQMTKKCNLLRDLPPLN